MNSIILLLTLGSLDVSPAWNSSIIVGDDLLIAQKQTKREPQWIYQQSREVVWPKLDPRDPLNSTLGAQASSSERNPNSAGKAPAIRGSQLKEEVPTYEQPSGRRANREFAQTTKPQKSVERQSESDEGTIEPQRESGRSKFAGGNSQEKEDDRLVDSSKPRFSDVVRQPAAELEEPFIPTARLKTSVMRQSSSSRESAPNPFEFRPASISDDPEESQRGAPYKSFAVGANEEDDLGAEPYNAPLPSGHRGDAYLASNRGDNRDTNRSAEEGGDSTLQGGNRVPGTNPESSMWGSIVLVLLLFASVAGNCYLAWVAREFYERYRSLAQQVRSARNNLT